MDQTSQPGSILDDAFDPIEDRLLCHLKTSTDCQHDGGVSIEILAIL